MKILKIPLALIGVLFCILVLTQCKDKRKHSSNPQNDTTLIKKDDSITIDDKTIEHYTLSNSKGMEVGIITYGGRITSLKVPDKEDKYENVVIGFDSLIDYTKDNPYFGAIIGRYGNRIAKGEFTLDDETYELATNDGPNHLHGGKKGFDKVIWEAIPIDSTNSLKLSYVSDDMEEGYPGRLKVNVIYTLEEDNALKISYEAETDKKTIVNLTNHSYFNLSGDFSKNILDTQVKINADEFLPIDSTLIPTGQIRKVADTPFDFREEKPVSKDIKTDNAQLNLADGYDHCWVLNESDDDVRWVASALAPKSGRKLNVYTTEPGLQFYTGNSIPNDLSLRGGGNDNQRVGFAMETEHYPNSPNEDSFPSVVLEPGKTYTSQTIYKFSVE